MISNFVFLAGLLSVLNSIFPNQLDERLIGTWIMVKREKDSTPFADDSIQNEFTYTYAKNGDYIFDIRLVRKMAQLILKSPNIYLLGYFQIHFYQKYESNRFHFLDSKNSK